MTEVTMTQDARPSGASTKQRVFGDQKQAPGDPFMAPFFETAVEHVWGGVWNRPGLALKYHSLVVVSALAAIGQNEETRGRWRHDRDLKTVARRKFDQAFLGHLQCSRRPR